MQDDTLNSERSMTASIAVFLFAIARHWREVRASDGTRIPNHLFASSRAGAFLLENGPPEHLLQEWNIPPGAVHLGPTKDTIDDVIAYLGLSTADIQFLERYYRLTGGMRAFSLFGDHRKFKALCERTPGFTVDMRTIADLAAPASPDARYADPETLDELLYLDPDTLIPLNATYEFVLGKGDRAAGRRALNDIELSAGILLREDDVHIAISDVVPMIESDTEAQVPRGILGRLRDLWWRARL
jgi:hypothetical protein